MPEQTALVLSWRPEIEDYTEAFRAKDRMRRVPEIFGVMVVTGAVLGIAGLWGSQPMIVGVGIALIITPVYSAGPAYYLSVRSIWRRSPTLRLPVEVRVNHGEGLTGARARHSWSSRNGGCAHPVR